MPKRTSSTLREEAEAAELAAGMQQTQQPLEKADLDSKSSERPTKLAKGDSSGEQTMTTSIGDVEEPAESAQTENGNSAERPKHLKLKEEVGDIFDAPDGTVIIHACNTIGSWGAGIAASFKEMYPGAYEDHRQWCKKNTIRTGSAQLIPPLDGNPVHWVGCVFTSALFGKKKDAPAQILKATGPAILDLLRQIANVKKKGQKITEVRICQINSGLFKVPWEKTVKVLESLELEEEMPETMTVYIPE